ncbi:hypothetical protein NEHOM01_1330 [Nematocida homosporus]|uniref:uncharacterized protein n=1 Tax=Nematocida homosporus TaxID=1912981 RepID=UPI002221055A|nr:uncharacterized protein NEHOM01_1330 [Nematocida homosporus]KAI5186165.1 hypothetical protein NEHOM01_1330 [Nematocida homosporus]
MHRLLLGFCILVLIQGRLVLLDDLSSTVHHGNIVVDSTKTDLPQVAHKIRVLHPHHNILTQDSPPLYYTPNPYINTQYIESPTANTNLLDTRVQNLYTDLQRVKHDAPEEDLTLLSLQSKHRAQKQSLHHFLQERHKTNSILAQTKKDLATVQTNAELLKSKLQDLHDKSTSLSAKISHLQHQISTTQQELNQRTSAYQNRLTKITTRYALLRHEYPEESDSHQYSDTSTIS